MTSELYTLMLLETAVVAALVLICFLLDRASPEEWWKRWNVAWLFYLLHLPLSFLAGAGTPNQEVLRSLSLVLALAANTGLAVAVAFLAGQAKWEKRIWIAGGVLLLLGRIQPLALPAIYAMTLAAV